MSSCIEPAIEIRRHLATDPWTYELLNFRQREIGQRVLQGGPGALLLSELAPVITSGRRTPQTDLLMSEAALEKLGISRVETDRGGFATYHGPGQWVLFPVDRLERITGDPRGVRLAVDKLLQVAQRVALARGVETEIRQGAELGVWSKKGKLAAVGIHVEAGILLHGLSLNVFRTPQSFVGLKPCGLEAAVDYLAPLPDPEVFNEVKTLMTEAAISLLWGALG